MIINSYSPFIPNKYLKPVCSFKGTDVQVINSGRKNDSPVYDDVYDAFMSLSTYYRDGIIDRINRLEERRKEYAIYGDPDENGYRWAKETKIIDPQILLAEQTQDNQVKSKKYLVVLAENAPEILEKIWEFSGHKGSLTKKDWDKGPVVFDPIKMTAHNYLGTMLEHLNSAIEEKFEGCKRGSSRAEIFLRLENVRPDIHYDKWFWPNREASAISNTQRILNGEDVDFTIKIEPNTNKRAEHGLDQLCKYYYEPKLIFKDGKLFFKSGWGETPIEDENLVKGFKNFVASVVGKLEEKKYTYNLSTFEGLLDSWSTHDFGEMGFWQFEINSGKLPKKERKPYHIDIDEGKPKKRQETQKETLKRIYRLLLNKWHSDHKTSSFRIPDEDEKSKQFVETQRENYVKLLTAIYGEGNIKKVKDGRKETEIINLGLENSEVPISIKIEKIKKLVNLWNQGVNKPTTI